MFFIENKPPLKLKHVFQRSSTSTIRRIQNIWNAYFQVLEGTRGNAFNILAALLSFDLSINEIADTICTPLFLCLLTGVLGTLLLNVYSLLREPAWPLTPLDSVRHITFPLVSNLEGVWRLVGKERCSLNHPQIPLRIRTILRSIHNRCSINSRLITETRLSVDNTFLFVFHTSWG